VVLKGLDAKTKWLAVIRQSYSNFDFEFDFNFELVVDGTKWVAEIRWEIMAVEDRLVPRSTESRTTETGELELENWVKHSKVIEE
jgi:hypothetical protein